MAELNHKQDRFCHEYVVDFNGKQAAIRAGYSPKTAESQGSRLLSHAKVRARVQELSKKANDAVDFDAEWIRRKMRELHDRAEANLDDRIMGAAQLQARLLENMGKIEGQYVDRHEIDGRSGITFNIKTSRGKKK